MRSACFRGSGQVDPYRERRPRSLSEHGAVLPGDPIDLILRPLDRSRARRRPEIAEHAFDPGRGHHPEEKKLLVRILETVPREPWDEYRSAFRDQIGRASCRERV